MQLLAEITDSSVGTGPEGVLLNQSYMLRKSARAVLVREDGLVCTQYIGRDGYHKLPGGGVELGETIEEALQRELLEEVGCDSVIVRPLGLVIEYRAKYQLMHMSYGFVATVRGPIGVPALEPKEIEEQQVTEWMEAEVLFTRMQSEAQVMVYEGKFILARELALMVEYLAAKP